MEYPEPSLHALQEARRRAADRIRSLLEQLEVAEREFEELTEKVRMVSETHRFASHVESSDSVAR